MCVYSKRYLTDVILSVWLDPDLRWLWGCVVRAGCWGIGWPAAAAWSSPIVSSRMGTTSSCICCPGEAEASKSMPTSGVSPGPNSFSSQWEFLLTGGPPAYVLRVVFKLTYLHGFVVCAPLSLLATSCMFSVCGAMQDRQMQEIDGTGLQSYGAVRYSND